MVDKRERIGRANGEKEKSERKARGRPGAEEAERTEGIGGNRKEKSKTKPCTEEDQSRERMRGIEE
eukprot:12934532-Prorocentrum_lima.AAC.1